MRSSMCVWASDLTLQQPGGSDRVRWPSSPRAQPLFWLVTCEQQRYYGHASWRRDRCRLP